MTAYTVYQYDPVTGLMSGTNNCNDVAVLPWLNKLGYLVVKDVLWGIITQTNHDGTTETMKVPVQSQSGGWSFVLGADGKPAVDKNGNYLVMPPPYIPPPPSIFTHIFSNLPAKQLAAIAAAQPDIIHAVNWSLDTVKLPPIGGVPVVALPVKNAVTDSAAQVVDAAALLASAPIKG